MSGPAVPLRLLFWLRWKLTVRGFSRSKARWVGLVLLFVLVVPWSLAIAAGIFFALWKLPVGDGRYTGEQVLQGALSLTTFIWVVAPLLGFSVNESYDITRLFTFPIARHRIFTGALLGSLLDVSTLFLMPAFVAAVVALALRSPIAALAALAALPLFLIQTLALSQGIVLATQGILKSRKFRDIAMVVFPMLWVAYQIGNQFFWRSFEGGRWQKLVSGPFWKAFTLFPSGMAAHAVGAAARHEFAPTAGWLLLLATSVAVTLRVAGWLVGKAYDGESVGPAAPSVGQERRAGERSAWLEKLPPATAAVLGKEWLLFRRDPYFRLLLINLLSSIAVAGFLVVTRSQKSSQQFGPLSNALSDWVLLGGTALTLLQQSGPLYNQFGHDGFAAPLLFGFPARRRDVILGKNLALLSVALPLNAALSVGLCTVTRRFDALSMLVPFTLLATLVQASIGNVLSLAFPFRVALNNLRGRQKGASMGTGQSLLYLLVFLATNLFQLPIAAAVLAPRLWIAPVWIALTLPLAALYAGGLYLLSLKLFGPLIAERERYLVERLTQTDS